MDTLRASYSEGEYQEGSAPEFPRPVKGVLWRFLSLNSTHYDGVKSEGKEGISFSRAECKPGQGR